jgi:sugar phosphate isomerase/epimerase
LRAGFHNHLVEWRAVEGVRPIDLIAANTPKDFALQVDTATCLSAGADPTPFIKANAGRVKSYHCKDWSDDPEKGYKVLIGEGIGKWKEIIDAAEDVGGVEYYLIEQEGSRYSAMETAKRSLDLFKNMRATL